MIDKNNTIRIISSFLIISMILPSVIFSMPKKVSAFWGVFDTVIDAPVTATTGATATATTTSAAANTTLLGFKIKEIAIELGKMILRQIAKRVLAKMTQATINWINSDFHGSPLFIENPSSFFKDIAQSQIKSLINLFGYDSTNFPFGKQFALNTISSYKSQLANNAQYTLSKVINDPDLLDRYRNNFNTGGWNVFLINTQYPQNNYLGFQNLASEELARRLAGTVQNAAQKVQTKLQNGLGFLSPQTCPSNPAYNNGTNEFLRPTFKTKIPYNTPTNTEASSYDTTTGSFTVSPLSLSSGQGTVSSPGLSYGSPVSTAPVSPGVIGTSGLSLRPTSAHDLQYLQDVSAERAIWEKTNTCPGGLKDTTPGSVAANQVFSALNTPFLTTALDGALGNSLAAIFDALINHFIDKGLSALSDTVSGSGGSSAQNDHWSYDGQTLDGSVPPPADDTAISIPQDVSIRISETTSTLIRGGTPNYSIQTPPDQQIATATIDVSGSAGPKLKITGGVLTGITTVTIRDSSAPIVKTATVYITVSAKGAILVSPATLTVDTHQPVVAAISGGEEPYFFQIVPNAAVAVAIISGTNLIVSGIKGGATTIRLRDSSIPVKTVDVPVITISPDDLGLNTSDVTVYIGETTNIPLNGGTKPFNIIEQQDPTIASTQIPVNTTDSPDMLLVTGLKSGATSVTIKDSSNPFQFTTIAISVPFPLGICHKSFGEDFNLNQEMPKSACDALTGASWTVNSLKVTPSTLTLNSGEALDLPISGGMPSYTIKTEPNSSIATTEISANRTLTITGVAPGVTTAVLGDSSTPNQTLTVYITVPFPLGTCTANSNRIRILRQTTQAYCDSLGRTWTQNP